MLVGINADTLSIQNVVTEDRCVKFYVTSRHDNFKWVLVAVYGAAQEEHKPDFLAELVRICEDESLHGKKKKTMITLMLAGPLFSMR
jgi:hypothetical protein